jgi:hypothetical protein
MTDTITALKDAWAFILAAVALVAWFVRLEARAMRNSDDLTIEAASRKAELVALETRIEKQRKEDMELRRQDREDTKRMLQEVQSDIKLLLQRTAK